MAQHPDFGPALLTMAVQIQEPINFRLVREQSKGFKSSAYVLSSTNCVTEMQKQRMTGQEIVDADTLADLFSKLKGLQALSLWENDAHAYYRPFDRCRVEPQEIYDFEQIVAVFEAILVSGIRAKSLSMGFDGWTFPSDPENFLSNWPTICSNLTSLRLNVYCLEELGDGKQDLVHTVGELPELQELALINESTWSRYSDCTFMTHIFQCRFPQLERLYLMCQATSFPEFKKFLRRQTPNTPLKQVHATNMVLQWTSYRDFLPKDEIGQGVKLADKVAAALVGAAPVSCVFSGNITFYDGH